jgi:WD40 repeat protein
MDRIEISKNFLLRECYEWILRDSNLLEWRHGNSNPLLWISGDPGKGKTMLMIALIRELSNELHQRSGAVTFFFCQNTDSRLNSAVSILRGLIWKLAMNHPQLAVVFHDKCQSIKHMFNGSNAIHALFSALLAMLEAGPETFIFIDALDECYNEPEREQLLQLIMRQARSSSKVKWLLSSRNHQDIKQLLKTDSRTLSLELNQQHISQAVVTFITKEVIELTEMNDYTPDLARKVEDELIRKAGSTFLWVALVCKRLRQTPRWKTLSILTELPPGLDKLYARMMEEVLQYQDVEDRNFCLQILRSVTLAFRPLSKRELVTGAKLPMKLLEHDGLSELIKICGSFIIIRDGFLYFVHQSAKDYLVGDRAQKLFPTGFQTHHGLIVSCSLDIMSRTLKRDICNLKHPGSSPRNAEIHPLEAIKYACSFWLKHLAKYLNDSADGIRYQEYIMDHGIIHNFLLKHLLHWIEALSIIGEVDRGILGLRSLERMLEELVTRQSETSLLKDFVHDAIRVLRQFRPAIEEAPLQVYCATLIFAPQNSLVRQIFKQEAPRWISPLPRVRTEWSPCLQALEGHTKTVNSVVFSPNGQQLASCSGDYTVRLWDAASGACLQTFEGHTETVNSVVFSPNGQQLASCSGDYTVRLWNVASGACLQTLEGHIGWINLVVFSPNGQQLASCSGDYTVRLWGAVSGACLRTFEGHADTVNSVVFSPNGQQLASCSANRIFQLWDTISTMYLKIFGQQLTSNSHDRTVRLWDAASGTCLKTFEGHTSTVNSAVFSPNGQQLMSCSGDHTVRLWNAASGACLQTLEGHTDTVTSAVFSPNGQQLASCSVDHTVRLWNAASGACLQTLEGHTGWINLVVFSPNGQQLASCSGDYTVRLWDAVSGACLRTFEGHADTVNSVVFSPNGQQLASCSHDHTVRLWDAASRTCLQTLKCYTDCVHLVVFSPNGQQLASCSDDRTVRLWNAVSGACLQTLKGHMGRVNSVVFSSNGQQLASCSRDLTVRLWDTVSGVCLQTFEGHTDYVCPVMFSPNDQQLVSCSNDRTVRLWDTVSGTCKQTFEGHTNCVRSVVFSPNGQQLASCSSDHTVRLWKAASGACLQTLEGHTDWINLVMFSPNGQQLASCSSDHTVRLWNAVSGACLQTLKGHMGRVNSVVFSSNGQQLASCSVDQTVRLWDTVSGVCLQTFEGHTIHVESVMFSPNGQQLASCSLDHTVRFWDAVSGACLRILEGYTHTIVFSHDGSKLITDFGVLSVEQFKSDTVLEKIGLSIGSKKWITWNGKNILWLPPEYRASKSAAKEHRVGVGCSSGLIYILSFHPNNFSD